MSREGGRQPLEPGLVRKCANTKRMSDWTPVADVSCSWLLPQVSWFMHFTAMKHKRCYCSSKFLTGCSFHVAWSLPPYQWGRTTTLQLSSASFQEAQLQVSPCLALFSSSWIQLTIPLSTQDHGRKKLNRAENVSDQSQVFQVFFWSGFHCLPHFHFSHSLVWVMKREYAFCLQQEVF